MVLTAIFRFVKHFSKAWVYVLDAFASWQHWCYCGSCFLLFHRRCLEAYGCTCLRHCRYYSNLLPHILCCPQLTRSGQVSNIILKVSLNDGLHPLLNVEKEVCFLYCSYLRSAPSLTFFGFLALHDRFQRCCFFIVQI